MFHSAPVSNNYLLFEEAYDQELGVYKVEHVWSQAQIVYEN